MANEIGNTEAAAVIPEVWRRIVLDSREAKQVVVPRVLNVTQELKSFGDIVHIPIFPQTLSINTVGSGGTVTNQAITLTDVTLTVNKHEELTVTIEDQAQIQSIVDLFATFAKNFGIKTAGRFDNQLLAEHSNITTNTLGGATSLSDSDLTEAVRLLDDGDIPSDDRSWIFAPIARRDLFRSDKFTLANQTGLAKGVQLNGMIGDVYGSPVLVTSNVATDSSQRKNFYMHREALAIAIQKNVRMERFARVQLATTLNSSFLYGVKTIRENHAVIISTNA